MRHDGESRDTDRLTRSRHRRIFGGQGVCREAGSEGLEENHRVGINGSNPDDEPVAKDGARSSPHYGDDGAWVPLRRTKVCAGDTVGKNVSDSGRPGHRPKARYGWNSATLADERTSNRERKAQPEAGQG